ncbi:MAG: exodeoxyribonuclease VII large subunit [Blastocatellia bacterium]
MPPSRRSLLDSLFADDRVLTVTELTEQVRGTLEAEYSRLQVQGEISNYKRAASGHWYFTLKDEGAQVRAVFFRQWNRLMRFEPENGLEVRVRGGLSVYAERGDYQVMVESLEPVGVGALQLAFEQHVKRLAAEGLFDEAHKKPLPFLPRRIGIVTSPTGAVVQDILRILERRNPHIDVIVAPVRVQGNTAAGEIADAIRLLNKRTKQKGCEIDVIIVARGGGSLEDLWAFNEEQVARAIYNSEIPVISAVGHETDYTIADFVADMRAPTPSAAAELAAPESAGLRARVDELGAKLGHALGYYLLKRDVRLRDLIDSRGFAEVIGAVQSLRQRHTALEERAARALQASLDRARQRLGDGQRRLAATDFRAPIKLGHVELDALTGRLERAVQSRLIDHSHRVLMEMNKLNLLSPLAVLGRGYALVRDENGRLVTTAGQLQPGQDIRIRFEDGETGARVTSGN